MVGHCRSGVTWRSLFCHLYALDDNIDGLETNECNDCVFYLETIFLSCHHLFLTTALPFTYSRFSILELVFLLAAFVNFRLCPVIRNCSDIHEVIVKLIRVRIRGHENAHRSTCRRGTPSFGHDQASDQESSICDCVS